MKTRTTLALATTAIITLALAGCNTAVQDNNGNAQAGCINVGSAGGYSIYDCQIRLRDTRRVNCVVSLRSGIDCDWTHADGSDAL